MKTLSILILGIFIGLCLGFIPFSKTYKETKLYKEYYKQTESLLDTLENQYNWIDAIDHYGYYDAVYNIKH